MSQEQACQTGDFVIKKYFKSWASADFFPGEGKKFPGGARTYFLPKKLQKRYYFSQNF